MINNSSTRRNKTGADSGVFAQRNVSGCDALALRLKQVEFALVDIILYLDSYPDCKTALSYYHKLLSERETLLDTINQQCGPMTSFDNVSTTEWRWIEGPWPWMIDAN